MAFKRSAVRSRFRQIGTVEVFCDYDHNSGTAYFDDIQLIRNGVEKGLSPEDFPAEVEDTISDETETVYDDIYVAPEFQEQRDAFGNPLTETAFTDGEFGTIYRSFGYDENGNDLIRETDARGNTTVYTVDTSTSRNSTVTDRCGNKTLYEYDTSGRTAKVTNTDAQDTELANVSYTYDAFDTLSEIVRGDGLKYVLQYNNFHNLESIGVDGKTEKLVSYTYKTGNGRLKQISYANGDYMKAIYNNLGQMVSEKWYNASDTLTAHYKYAYDCQGNIVRSVDILSQKEYNYNYEDGRLLRSTEFGITVNTDGFVAARHLVCEQRYTYDTDGNLIRKRIIPASGSKQVIYYENAEGRNTVVKFAAGGNTVTSHSKNDSFGRKVFDELQLGSGFVSRQFLYHPGEASDEHINGNDGIMKSTPTTNLVSRIILSDGRTLSYEYDAEERITKVIDSYYGTTEYTYDALGQLLTETVNDVVVNTMTYDNYGNILTKNGVTYTYGDSAWKDKLTVVGDETISYDAQGNPTTYLGHTLTWEKGRQLKSFGGNTYTYNANGIRTSKTVNGVKHTYLLDGTKILRETWGDNVLIPLYDNEDSVCGILYNATPYYFLKNLQGDVIAITDQEGTTVAQYSYDAWGICTGAEDTSGSNIATINPFRYRGYYYDAEIGMYYLQSRYYDPYIGRFLNADDARFVVFTDNKDHGSLFSYCENDVVNQSDRIGFASNTFWAGFGLQIELGGSAGFIGMSYGIELIWYTSSLVSGRKGFPYAYEYSSGSFGLSGKSLIEKVLDKFFKSPSTIFSSQISFSVSVCILAIWGNKKKRWGKKKFSSPDDYLGKFKTKSATVYHVKAFYSTSDTCFAVGTGFDFSKWAISNSTSNYKYCNWLENWIQKMSSVYNYIFNKAQAIKA